MANAVKKCVLHGAVNGDTVDLYPRTNLASVSDMTAFARTLNGAADAAAARNTLGITTQAALINIIYPVGSVITLTNNTDPNKIYSGTTWVKMDAGRVLVSAGTYTEGSDTYTYALGSKGGEAKHQLTVEELASHSHNGTASSTSLTGKAWARGPEYAIHGSEGILGVYSITNDWFGQGHAEGGGHSAGFTIDASHSHTVDVTSSGGNTSHENRMPYTVVQMWKRTI